MGASSSLMLTVKGRPQSGWGREAHPSSPQFSPALRRELIWFAVPSGLPTFPHSPAHLFPFPIFKNRLFNLWAFRAGESLQAPGSPQAQPLNGNSWVGLCAWGWWPCLPSLRNSPQGQTWWPHPQANLTGGRPQRGSLRAQWHWRGKSLPLSGKWIWKAGPGLFWSLPGGETLMRTALHLPILVPLGYKTLLLRNDADHIGYICFLSL